MAAIFVAAVPGFARPDYTRRTKQECAYCHPPGGWYLNDAGKYFRDHRNLNGFVASPDPNKAPSQGSQNQNPGNQKSTAQDNKSKSQGK
ncbi:MAG: hypothetical protein ABL995_00070 [Bryobacteraceae bacterium]